MTNYKSLVGMFVEFLKFHNCERGEDGKIKNYLTIHPGENPDKPCWLKGNNSKYREDWPEMRRAASEMGIHIGYHHGRGWFLGTAKDAGEYTGGKLKTLLTRTASLVSDLAHSEMIPDDEERQDFLDAVNKQVETPLSFEQYERAFKGIANQIGVPLKTSTVALLMATIAAQDEAEDDDMEGE